MRRVDVPLILHYVFTAIIIRMKAKLTVTVDEDLLPRAKAGARRRGQSLSRVIEDALRDLADESEPSFAERWRGQFRPARRKSERYRYLAKKYL